MDEKKKKRRHREIYLAIILTAGILGSTVFFSKVSFLTPPHELEGKTAPEMVYMSSEGETSKLSKKKGIVVLLNFWAIWCDDCLKEMPGLHQIENHFGKKGLILLAFNIGERGEDIRHKLKGTSYPRNLVFNFSKKNLESYGIKGLPMSVLIDKKGTVRKVYQGPMNWTDLKVIKQIEDLLD